MDTKKRKTHVNSDDQIEVIHFDAVWKISVIFHPVFIDSRGAVDTNCWQMLPVASEDFALRLGSMFCRGEMLTGGYVAAITACARGQQWEETLNSDNNAHFFHFFSNDMFFKNEQIDFGYFCQNINFGLQFFLFWKMSF